MTPIRTPRLLLRELTLADDSFVLALLNEPGFIDNIGDKGARDLEGARRYLREGPLASYARHGHGLWHVALHDGTGVGICGLLRREGLEHADIGYAILQAHGRRGYAAEAAAACLDLGFGTFGMARILAITRPGNHASQGVLEKVGLRAAGRVELPGLAEAQSLYAVTAPLRPPLASI